MHESTEFKMLLVILFCKKLQSDRSVRAFYDCFFIYACDRIVKILCFSTVTVLYDE
jgi:hypothetical protein